MALYPVAAVSPCLSYNLWNGVQPQYLYNPYLIAPPRIYAEEISGIAQFFYEPGNDLLVAYIMMNIIDWPGWAVYRYTWQAETGAFKEKVKKSVWLAWINHAGNGSLNKIFTTRRDGSLIQEVTWDSLAYQGGWQADPSAWNPSTLFNYAVVNLQDGLLAGVSSWSLDIWNISGTPSLKGSLRLPNTLGYLAYEDRRHCWITTKDGMVAKANYRIPRWEMLSAVQDPSPDAINYLCAFDTRRKRLAVFRQRPNAADGACRCQLEFYRPIYRVAGLTDPVPVSALRAGERVRFVSHLYGDAGEGVAGYMVNAALEAPALGEVLTPRGAAELNGAITFRYQAPAPGQDTLQLSAMITDGEG